MVKQMSVIVSTDDLENICPNYNRTSHVTIKNKKKPA